jgi:hypothetical protein
MLLFIQQNLQAGTGNTGTIVVTDSADISAASGTVVGVSITGTIAITDDADVSVSSGVLAFSGSSSTTDGADISASSGALAFAGGIGVTDGADDSSTSSGTVIGGSISGAISVTDGDDVMSAAGNADQATVTNGAGFVRLDRGHYKYKYRLKDEELQALETAAKQRIENKTLTTLQKTLERLGVVYHDAYKQAFVEILAQIRAEQAAQDAEDEQIVQIIAHLL